MEALEIDTIDSTWGPGEPGQAAAGSQSLSPVGSWESSVLEEDTNNVHDRKPSRKGFFGGIFGSPSRPSSRFSSTSRTVAPNATTKIGDGDISQYWQNYDLSVSEAPKLFSDTEFDAVNRIRQGLEVLVLRKRLQERISMRNREREVRAAVRVQAIVRGVATRIALPGIREQHILRAHVKREQKLFKRELRSEGFTVYAYRNKDGALRKVNLKPNGKLNCLCWSMGVAKVKTGSVPLIALKSCYAGYPKHNFPTKSMHARATPLPDKSKTFTIQVDNGKVFVFVSAEKITGPSQKKLVKGLQSIIDEISSPDSFYFDGTGVLRRVTCSIFDDRGNVAHREAMKKQRHERFLSRQDDAEERREALRPQGEVQKTTHGMPQFLSRSLPRPTQAG